MPVSRTSSAFYQFKTDVTGISSLRRSHFHSHRGAIRHHHLPQPPISGKPPTSQQPMPSTTSTTRPLCFGLWIVGWRSPKSSSPQAFVTSSSAKRTSTPRAHRYHRGLTREQRLASPPVRQSLSSISSIKHQRRRPFLLRCNQSHCLRPHLPLCRPRIPLSPVRRQVEEHLFLF